MCFSYYILVGYLFTPWGDKYGFFVTPVKMGKE